MTASKNGRKHIMKVKKRYYAACVLMCIVALLLSVATFYTEMGLARYSKLNSVVSRTWNETSAADLTTRLNTDFFVTSAHDIKENTDDLAPHFDYIGTQTVARGKYVAYNTEVYSDNIVFNQAVKLGDRVSVYYKPDEPRRVYCITSYVQYIIILLAIIVITGVMLFVCRMLNKSLKDNTFSDAAVTIMDIPMVVFVAGVILAFFAGMLIGNIQVDSSWTIINQGIADQYAAHELTI